MYAERDFSEGEVVFRSQYSLVKVKKEEIPNICSNCLKPGPKFTCPEGCNYLHYCNIGCAEEHRTVHKFECFPSLSQVPERVRFVGLLMFTGPSDYLLQMTS